MSHCIVRCAARGYCGRRYLASTRTLSQNQRWARGMMQLRNTAIYDVILRAGRTAGRQGSWTISRARSCAATTSRTASTCERVPCCSTSTTSDRFAPHAFASFASAKTCFLQCFGTNCSIHLGLVLLLYDASQHIQVQCMHGVT